VTRLSAPHDVLDALPPWPRPLVIDLRHAPELAVLAVLHSAVRAALVALVAEHPTLADLGGPDEPPTLRRARRLIRCGLALGAALDGYRCAAIAAFSVSPPCDNELPF
jgi:hypothetical protein